MQVKIGSMYMDEGLEIAGVLRSAGIRVEIKPYFDVEFEEIGYIKGRIGELIKRYAGTEYEGVVREWEGYVKVGNEILKEPMTVSEFVSSFVDMFVEEAPGLEEVFNAALEKMCEERNVNIDDMDDEAKAEMVSEVLRRSREDIKKSMKYELNKSRYEFIATRLLEFSGIDPESDKIIEKLVDDVVIEVRVDDAEEAEKLGIQLRLRIDVRKMCDIYASLTDALYERSRLLKIVEKFEDAFKLLVVADIGLSTHKYLEEEGKMSVDEIVETLNDFELGEDVDVRMDEDAARELLRLLEKEELIKVKKGKVKAV